MIEGTSYTYSRPVKHVRVNHCRAHILVAEKFLHGADVITASEQLGRERMAQAMTIRAFHNSGGVHRAFQCVLQKSFSHVMTPSLSGVRIN